MNLLNGQADHEYLVALWIATPTCIWEDMGLIRNVSTRDITRRSRSVHSGFVSSVLALHTQATAPEVRAAVKTELSYPKTR